MQNNKFTFTTYLIFSLLFALTAHTSAQSISEIRSSGDYYFGEGVGITTEEAEQSAMERMVNSIKVLISTDRSRESQEVSGTEENAYTQYSSSKISVHSNVSLRNVNKKIIKGEPNAEVICWISKAELEELYKERSQAIIDYVESGKRAEQQLQIDDALRNYYWALVLSKTNRDAVYVEFNDKKQNCNTFLPSKIKSVISNIKCNLISCEQKDNRYYGQMSFQYNERDIASLQLFYNDGESLTGPVFVKDGLGELEFLSLPADNKIKLLFEYKFRKEAENLNDELELAFNRGNIPLINNAYVEVPVKVNMKRLTMKSAVKAEEGVSAANTATEAVLPEPASLKKRIEVTVVEDHTEYLNSLQTVEKAIASGNPELAYSVFTTEGYRMFQTLLKETGKISLVGSKQTYNFIRANRQILGRSCKVKIKFRDGKTFLEDLTFRFNEETKKITSLAFTLKKKAEDDIFNAAAKWPEISRFTILQFLEDYQTAYALRRLEYIKSLFSENALIITGTVLKPIQATTESNMLNLNNNEIKYIKMSKEQFIKRLKRQFESKEYIHITFEDNTSRIINAPRFDYGTAFGLEIKQYYNSSDYSDKGYLTLILDTSKEQPIIHVRLWQPDKKEMMSIEEFISKFKF